MFESLVCRVRGFFVPQENWMYRTALQLKRQRELQALWVGIVAFFMPVLLYYSNRTAECFRDSISHTYYTPFWGDVLVALSAFVGLSLLFYRGQSKAERILAMVAGVSAVVVAIIPATGTGCEMSYAPSRIFMHTNSDVLVSKAFSPGAYYSIIHGIAAGVLFLILTIFSLFVFTAIDPANEYQSALDNRNKRIRNRIYKITGYIMLCTLILLAANKFLGFPDCDSFDPLKGIGKIGRVCEADDKIFKSLVWDKLNLTFYFEWAALASFGVAWFVKGRGGGFLLLDEFPNRVLSKPWWWVKRN